MASRLDLQKKLEVLMGSRNVYFMPPSGLKLKIPAIVYSVKKRGAKFANNKAYANKTAYELIFIDQDPDNPLITTISELPYCEGGRPYTSDGNYHEPFTIYF